MIVVSASALMAVLLAELIAERRNIGAEMAALIEDLGFTIMPVAAHTARRVAEADARWGKGVHPAGLNFSDCFAYALASEQRCPLLFVGEDFARTDVLRAG